MVPPAPVAIPTKAEPPVAKPAPPWLTEQQADLRVKNALAEAEQCWAREASQRDEQRQQELDKQLSTLLDSFAAQSGSYFRRAESEIVHLALAISRKILQREASVDPELLVGLARTALDRMKAGSAVRLRVPRCDLPAWQKRDIFSTTRYSCELIADDALAAGDCIVETDLGAANFGFEPQLKQIEQGILDLVRLRPEEQRKGSFVPSEGAVGGAEASAEKNADPQEAFDVLHQRLEETSQVRWQGSVLEVTGNLIEAEGSAGALGDECELQSANGPTYRGEVIGFRGRTTVSMMTENAVGIRFGDPFVTHARRPSIRVSDALLGRVISPTGEPLDGGELFHGGINRPIEGQAPQPHMRVPIREPLGSGVRALDAFIPCGRGQRLGIFGGSGVGKSTLLGMMARGTAADVIVMALVGERGREVGEFLEVLGEEGLRRAVLVVSTSDQSALLRLRAPLAATAIAEGFAAQGRNVLLVVDSLTRFAMAQREIGLAAGEPPTAKGYTPSVLNKLASLVERAGRFRTGSITAFYTVLMEGDDQQDPVVDTVRSLLDGHIILDRKLALSGHYPPISVLDSLSRLMPSITTPAHLEKARGLRELLSSYARSEDLIRIGAYQRGGDPLLDKAMEHLPALQGFLRQSTSDLSSFEETERLLLTLPS